MPRKESTDYIFRGEWIPIGDAVVKLPDNAGAYVWEIQDSDGNPVFYVDSDGQITWAHNEWQRAIDNAGTGFVNWVKINNDDLAEIGATMLLNGNIEAQPDSGANTLANMPVTSDASDGDEMSFALMIDSEVIAKVYAEADGTGGIKNKKLVLGTGVTFSAQTYAEAYINSAQTQTIAVASTWYEVGTLTAGESSGITFASDRFTVPADGKYQVIATLSTSSASANKTFSFGIGINGSDPTTKAIIQRRYGVTDVGASAISAIVDLSAGEYINLMVRGDTDTTNIDVDFGNIQIHEV